VEKKPPSKAQARGKPVRQPRRIHKLSSDEIFERLLLAIMEHRLPPGTQLVEARLAAIFKVSRTKVREAIGRLVHDCIATAIPNRGAFVSSPTVTQAREVFAARRLIEPALVREVTRQATPAQIAALRSHLEKEAAAQRAGDQRQIITLSGEFHFLIADMAGNSFLSRTLRELETLSALIIILFAMPTHQGCPGDHPALVDAIELGDQPRAAELMLHHLAHVERSVYLESPDKAPATLEEAFA
jgi:DNA-binding GntR family transcriptional regulator